MLALKFKTINFTQLLPFVIVLMVGLLSAFLLQWMAAPEAVITYVFVSLLFKKQ